MTLHWDGTFPKWAPASLLQHLKTPFCAAGRVKVTFPIFWASIWTLIVFQHHTPLSNRILNRRRTLWMWDMSQAERFSHPPKLATITLPWKSNTIRFEGKKLASLKLNAFTQVVWYIHLLPFIKQCTLSLMFHIIVWSDLPHCVTTVWVYLLTIEDNSAGSISQYSIRRKSKKQSEKTPSGFLEKILYISHWWLQFSHQISRSGCFSLEMFGRILREVHLETNTIEIEIYTTLRSSSHSKEFHNISLVLYWKG